jgi:hypothetical protein
MIQKKLRPHYRIYLFGRRGWINFKHPAKEDVALAKKALLFAEREMKKEPHLLFLDELASRPSRNFVSQTLEKERSDRIISRAIEAFNHFPLKRIPIGAYLSEDFSISGFRTKREQGNDVVKSLPVAGPTILFEKQ